MGSIKICVSLFEIWGHGQAPFTNINTNKFLRTSLFNSVSSQIIEFIYRVNQTELSVLTEQRKLLCCIPRGMQRPGRMESVGKN